MFRFLFCSHDMRKFLERLLYLFFPFLLLFTKETMFYPGSGTLDGGKTLRPALVYINGDVSNTELIYLKIVMCV